MPMKGAKVDDHTGSTATVPVFGDFNEAIWNEGGWMLFTKIEKPKAVSPPKRLNESIRHWVLKASKEEADLDPVHLKGRGHGPRIAGILRGLNLPRLRIDAYDPNHFCPAMFIVRAQKAVHQELGGRPMAFDGSKVEPSVHRVEQPNPPAVQK